MKMEYGFRQRAIPVAILISLMLSGCGDSSSSVGISSFSPSGGTVATTVTVVGSNFDTTAANNAVAFNGKAAVVTSSSSTEIVTTVPSGATTGKISVTVNGETATSSADFKVIPFISSISPVRGSVGTTVTINGTGFDPTKSNDTVKFNGTEASVTSVTSTSIVTTVPSGASSGQITVSVNGQSAVSSVTFAVD